MTSQTVAQLLEDMGVGKSHARPHSSHGNPFSEAQFETLKYRPDDPQRFADLLQARTWATSFFALYNHQHLHSSLGLMTPAAVHFGLAISSQLNASRYCKLPMRCTGSGL